MLALDAVAERVPHLRLNVFGEHPPLWTDDRRQPDRVIALARADVGDGHAARYSCELHYLLGLADAVARILGREGVADDRRDIAVGAGEPRFAWLRAAGGKQQRSERCRPTPHP